MNYVVDKAIVLGRINYGEADRIATLICEQTGKVTVLAKGVRRPKSKLAGGLEIFNINEITYIPGKKDISTLVSSRLQKPHHKLVQDFTASQKVFEAFKWLNGHLEAGTGAEYYSLLAGMLELAESNPNLAMIWFYMRALEQSGHSINPFHDPSGNKLTSAQTYAFDYDSSVFVPKTDGEYSQEDIKLLRLALGLSIEDFARIGLSDKQAERILLLINRSLQLNF
ncbi:DNA repair protein RecO [Candidatus Saccharibacteria bacterium]|nr:DNA repair protein RecO [Candidatus Saccharibacteria bacterium]MCB9821375.1 DNA repair protein RecO [Candidatus Nomurabacteria bacterium]